MADAGGSRFAPQSKTTNERLSTNTVGLVKLSDFRKRRAEVLEQQDREAREALTGTSSTPATGNTTPDRTGSDSARSSVGPQSDQQQHQPPAKKKLKKKKPGKKLLSFDDDDQASEEGDESLGPSTNEPDGQSKSKLKPNAALGFVPKSMTKAALRKEATEREALRKEFLAVQEAVKATEIAIPFVFYDGANLPGGVVRVKKGDFSWVFLDKSRKVGAELGVGNNAKKSWARVGVDDLMLVRGTVIIPHHYDFYYFLINKSVGPGGRRIFNYSADAPAKKSDATPSEPITTSASRAEAAKAIPDISTLEGADDDPTLTKVVDRRWYERNKHIYPASTWQEFDPEKNYTEEIRRDAGGNAFFYS